jgi:predicted Zn finger-like uncharacterized protein
MENPESFATTVTCPSCGQAYRLSLNQQIQLQGKSLKCRKCQQSFLVQPVRSDSGEMTQPAPQEIPLAPTAPRNSPGQLRLEGSFTPAIPLLPGESIQETFEARALDLGLLGWMFGNKKRLILTSHRIIRFEKRLLVNNLAILWLPQMTSAAVGQGFQPVPLATGIVIALCGLANLFTLLVAAFAPREIPHQATSLVLLFGIAGLLVGAALIWAARMKIMQVNTAGGSAGLKVTRVGSDESQRFVEKLFASLDQHRRATSQPSISI